MFLGTLDMSDSPVRRIRRDDLAVFDSIPGLVCLARDESLRVVWTSRTVEGVFEGVDDPGDMLGTRLTERVSPEAAREREGVLRSVIERDEVVHHTMLSVDSRMLVTVFPLDEGSFGHKGTFAVISDAKSMSCVGRTGGFTLLPTPHFVRFAALTTRELEVLHQVARGETTASIAERLHRSPKTVENHINSIHQKLGTHSRAELVLLASEHGVHQFSEEEWARVVHASKRVRVSASLN